MRKLILATIALFMLPPIASDAATHQAKSHATSQPAAVNKATHAPNGRKWCALSSGGDITVCQ